MNIAIVGATGNVGRKTLEVLEKKELSIDNLYLVASSKSAGKKISFKGKEHEIFDLENFFTDIHKYLRLLEEAVILTLKDCFALDFHLSVDLSPLTVLTP